MLYLAYGMNTNLDQMARRCPQAESLGRYDLHNFRLCFRGPADIEYSPGDSLQCVLWRITKDCERSLDLLEGYPTFYTKRYIPVSYNGVPQRAMIYQMVDFIGYDPPGDGYVRMLDEGYRSHGLDTEQIYSAKGYQLFDSYAEDLYN